MAFRVLVIPGNKDARGSGLDFASEISIISNISGLAPENLSVEIVLESEATELSLTNRFVVRGQQFDALHFLGHASSEGFPLPNGDFLNAPKLHQLANSAGAKLVFLNACSTGRLGQYLVNRKVSVCLAYAIDVLDSDAILTATRFYAALSRSNQPYTGGLREAYVTAAPEDGSLLWLTNGQYVNDIIAPLLARMESFDKERTEAFQRFENSLNNLGTDSQKTLGLIERIEAKFITTVETFKVSHTSLGRSVRQLMIAVIIAIIIGLVLFFVSSVYGQTVPQPTNQVTETPQQGRPPTDTPSSPCDNNQGQGKQPCPTPNSGTPDNATPTPVDTPEPSIPPPDTPVPPTDTPTEVPPTDAPTEVPPTDTEVPPTDTQVPPTDTPTQEPTATEVPPTISPTGVSTNTPAPTNTKRPKRTSTPTPFPTATPVPPVPPIKSTPSPTLVPCVTVIPTQ